MIELIPYLIIGVLVIFILYVFLRQILFYGFTPIMPTRPEAIKTILGGVDLSRKKKPVFYALGFGRSGFLKTVEKDFPEAELVGVEDVFLYYFIAKIQSFIKKSKIKVVFSDFYRINVRKADVVYCYLNPTDLRDIYKKLIADTKDGAQVISTGFAMPYLDPIKVIEIKSQKKWFSFIAKRDKELMTPKERMEKRDNKVYFYEL